MKKQLLDHAFSILFVTLIFLILLIVNFNGESFNQQQNDASAELYSRLQDIDFGNPLHKALFKETLDLFYPNKLARNDSLLQTIESNRLEKFTNQVYKTGGVEKGFSWAVFFEIGGMYIDFIFIYIIVMAMSYYAAQTLAIFIFVRRKQQADSYLAMFIKQAETIAEEKQDLHSTMKNIGQCVVLLLKAIFKGLVYLVLFSPAYIIAYSLKSTFETGGYVFMIGLGIISNGLLINYAYKFYTFLLNESRKGYVQTAIVKGLNNSYEWNTSDGISLMSMLKLRKSFDSHVFQHIYSNARYQYIPTMKQYASFLITGLIIIEMALNIQGHLCYELLQDILYRRYNTALTIIFGIFIVVKATEILVDYWFFKESEKYEND